MLGVVGTDGARDRKNWRRRGPRDVANVSVASTLNVEPADLITFSDGHREVGGQIDSALDADAPVVTAMPAAYGTVGAVFTAAVDGVGSGVVEVEPGWTLTPPWVNNNVPIN